MVIALCSLANVAWAADKKDWLDEMPTVPAVVQAVRGDNCTSQFGDDEDRLAAEIVGTLMLLRNIMYLQITEEGGVASDPGKNSPQRTKWIIERTGTGLKNMPKQRLARFEKYHLEYMQAELVIGRGTGKRRGLLTTRLKCDSDKSFSMKVRGQTLDCYRYQFHNLLSNIHPSFDHRRQVLPKLFSKDRAQHYVALVTRYALAFPALEEPATTLTIPSGLSIEYPMPASDYCARQKYGDDLNHNGLCDDWEKPLSRTAQAPEAGRSDCPTSSPALSQSACLPPIQPSELGAFLENQKNEANRGLGNLRLVGGYECIDTAAAAAMIVIRALSDIGGSMREFGLLIMKPKGKEGPYYFTVPVAGPLGECFLEGAVVSGDNYTESRRLAFQNSCENREDFRIVGNIHSHPTRWCHVYQNGFSGADFNSAILGMGDGMLEKIFLVAPNGRNYQFAPERGDQQTDPLDLLYRWRTQPVPNNVQCPRPKKQK